MRDHIVTIEEVRGALTPPDIIVCSFGGADGSKQLTYQHSRCMFVISANGKFQRETTNIRDAVEAYNSALR